MAIYKEIVTKTVIGKGKKYFKNNYTLTPTDKPTTVLGCWVINHQFKGYKTGEKIGVDGSFDINIWYSYDNDSKTTVVSKKIDYNDVFNVKTRENSSGDTDVIVRTLKQPNCVKVNILENGDINFDIEKELGVEIVGEGKVKIAVEEEEDPWDEIEDDVDDKVLNQIDESVDEKYI